MKLGIIADDFTGAVDAAGFVQKQGLKTVLYNGIPSNAEMLTHSAEAAVICLKIRSCPVDQAVQQALTALALLKAVGCNMYYYKYCSTFDSSTKGNIGQVTDAIMQNLGVSTTVICPALPINGRTVYKGYLFVGDMLIQDSSMRHHPITPMRESYLPTLMKEQFKSDKVLHVYREDLEKGLCHVKAIVDQALNDKISYIIPDVLDDSHLLILAKAFSSLHFLTGGSGLAGAVAGILKTGEGNQESELLGSANGTSVIFSGSCSQATNEQLDFYKSQGAFCHSISIESCLKDIDAYCISLSEQLKEHLSDELAPMVYATKTPEERELLDIEYPGVPIADMYEQVFTKLTVSVLHEHVGTIVVAGGETAGTVVTACPYKLFQVGSEISPGVSWIIHVNSNGNQTRFALKSGNFGTRTFFRDVQGGVKV